jgi:putative transposase
VQNAFIESFNGKFRDECLNEHWFLTLQEAQLVIEAWRREYNEERTHSTIGDVTPQEFITNHQNGAHLTQEFNFLSFGVINGVKSWPLWYESRPTGVGTRICPARFRSRKISTVAVTPYVGPLSLWYG